MANAEVSAEHGAFKVDGIVDGAGGIDAGLAVESVADPAVDPLVEGEEVDVDVEDEPQAPTTRVSIRTDAAVIDRTARLARKVRISRL